MNSGANVYHFESQLYKLLATCNSKPRSSVQHLVHSKKHHPLSSLILVSSACFPPYIYFLLSWMGLRVGFKIYFYLMTGCRMLRLIKKLCTTQHLTLPQAVFHSNFYIGTSLMAIHSALKPGFTVFFSPVPMPFQYISGMANTWHVLPTAHMLYFH